MQIPQGERIGRLLLLVLFFTLMACDCFATFNVKKSSSKIRVKSGANFVAQKKINNYQGELIKESGANVSGDKISFVDGTFEDAGNKIKLTGDLDLLEKAEVILNGFQTFKGKRGSSVKTLRIKGFFNRLEGILQETDDVVLQDHQTSMTIAVQGRMPCNIALNGGTLSLEEDLHFVDDVFFTGSGTVQLNKRNLHLGSQEMTSDAKLYFDNAQDIELHANFHLAEAWTFSGESVLEGNGRILYLEDGGSIVIENGSSLLLRDVTLRNVSGANVCCLDEHAKICFQNVTWIQDGNYTFTMGSFEVLDKLVLAGNHTFAYQSAQTSTVGTHSRLVVDRGMTFSFDPIWNSSFWAEPEFLFGSGSDPWDAARNFIALEDETSIFELKGATLHVTSTSMKLTKGIFRVKDHSYIVSELDGEFHMEEGLIIGDNDAASDMKCEICVGSILEVSSGALSYKNELASSWDMLNDRSILSIASGGKLKLHQTLDVGLGVVTFAGGSRLARARGKQLLGGMHMFGSVYYEKCYN